MDPSDDMYCLQDHSILHQPSPHHNQIPYRNAPHVFALAPPVAVAVIKQNARVNSPIPSRSPTKMYVNRVKLKIEIWGKFFAGVKWSQSCCLPRSRHPITCPQLLLLINTSFIIYLCCFINNNLLLLITYLRNQL